MKVFFFQRFHIFYYEHIMVSKIAHYGYYYQSQDQHILYCTMHKKCEIIKSTEI